MRYIELMCYIASREESKTIIFINKIVSLVEKTDHTLINMSDDTWCKTKTPYQEVKDLIAATYGAEDEED